MLEIACDTKINIFPSTNKLLKKYNSTHQQ